LTGEVRRGKVDTFDDAAGLGMIRADDGGAYPFHCTQITGGTRTIEPGTTVEFVVFAGHMGRWEARSVTALGSSGS
jgi:cold shock CspA family protein